MTLPDSVPFKAVVKIVSIVFAAGMLYANFKYEVMQNAKDIAETKKQMERQIESINEYLAAMRRNGL